jgi:hypothetical protein
MTGKSPRTKRGLTPQERDVKASVQRAKNRAKSLLKKHNKDIREIRSQVAALKRAGIVSKNIDARSYQPTKYMLNKIKRNRDILEGQSIAIKAPKNVREKYKDAGTFETRGSSIIVPKEKADQRGRIKKGLVETRGKLKNGEWRKVILPFKASDMQQIAERLMTDPSLDGLKDPLELWGASIFGHPLASGFGWPDASELGDYILRNYQHLFSGKNKQTAIKNFELVRFITVDSNMTDDMIGTPRQIDDEWKRRNKQGNEWSIRKRKERRAAQAKDRREKETPEQRKNRLEKQRERSARNRDKNKKG